VEAVFEGSDTGVAAMIDWMRHGPPRAQVTGTRVMDEQPDSLTGFVVR
jgi:acylphosphatase